VGFDSSGTVQVISGRVLRVVENSTTYNLNLTSSSKYSTYRFGLAADGNGGSEVVVTAVTSGGTAIQATLAAVGKASSAAAAPSSGVSDHLDHGAHDDLVFRDGTGADSNFFWVNSNGDFGGWTGLSNSAPDLLFRNGVAEDPGLRRLGGNATVPRWYDIASENIAGASAALANETGTAAADLLYLGGTSDLGSRNMTADFATPEDSTLRTELDVTRSSTAYKIVR
jgi:hypothetical protein